MLVLSRRVNESIQLPDLNISIEVLQIRGKSVRVGISAPTEVNILRSELAKNESPLAPVKTFDLTGKDDHEVRNNLHALNLAFATAKTLTERGEFNLAAEKLNDMLEKIADDPTTTERSKGYAALVVEDVDNEREMLAGFLRLHGYHVDTVPDGLAALDYLDSNPHPDMIMLDIGMPRMNGAELITKIRENPSLDTVKLFAISGETPRSAEVNLQNNRVSRWFQKPLQPAQLVSDINREFRTAAAQSN